MERFDVLMKTREGAITRMGPYTRSQAESIARLSRTEAEVVPHNTEAVHSGKETKRAK